MSENDNEHSNEAETEIENTEAEIVSEETSVAAEDGEDIIDVEAEAHEPSLKNSSANVNLDTLLKVPVNLSIEVGRTNMALNEVLDTREGTVIELERRLDQPLDILVNGSLVAHGVVVLANDRFGIQITDIVSLHERALNL